MYRQNSEPRLGRPRPAYAIHGRGLFRPNPTSQSSLRISHLFILRYKRKSLLSAVATLILGHLIVNQPSNAMTIYIYNRRFAHSHRLFDTPTYPNPLFFFLPIATLSFHALPDSTFTTAFPACYETTKRGIREHDSAYFQSSRKGRRRFTANFCNRRSPANRQVTSKHHHDEHGKSELQRTYMKESGTHHTSETDMR